MFIAMVGSGALGTPACLQFGNRSNCTRCVGNAAAMSARVSGLLVTDAASCRYGSTPHLISGNMSP
jgi:hypothetical protein